MSSDNHVSGVGSAASGANTVGLVARFGFDGSLDTTFNGNGFATYTKNAMTIFTVSLVQPDNKIVAAGYTVFKGKSYLILVRYNNDGTVDTTFGD